MFLHEHSPQCKALTCSRKRCPNKHSDRHLDDVTESDKEDQDDIEELESDSEDQDDCLNENQCHTCRKQLNLKDNLYQHVESEHEAYFQGILDSISNLNY